MYIKVRGWITEALKGKNYINFVSCPYCGARAIEGKRVLEWNKGYIIFECLEGCAKKSEKEVQLDIG